MMQALARSLFNKLDDWIYYTYKVENEAVCELSKQLKGFIEAEKKMQKEISLNYVDVVTSNKTLNFLTPPVFYSLV